MFWSPPVDSLLIVASTERDRVILAGLVFAVLVSQVLLYPGIAALIGEFGIEGADDGLGLGAQFDAAMWFLAIEFLGYLTFVGIWGLASDRLGSRRWLIVFASLGGAIGYLGMLVLATSLQAPFEVVLFVRFIQGAMTIGALSLGMTMLMDLDGGHGRNMGAAGLAIGLGAFLGSGLGGILTSVHPFAPLVTAAGLLLIVGLSTVLVIDRAPRRSGSIRRTIDEIVDTPVLSVPFAFGFIDRFTAGFFALVGVFYFQQELGLGEIGTGMMLSLFFLPFAILQYPMGRLSDRIGRTYPIVLGSAMYGLAIIAVGQTDVILFAAIGMILVGVLGSLVSPATMALVTDLSVETDRATSMSGFNFFGSLGFLGGFLVGGTASRIFGFEAGFLVAGGVEILLALVTIPLFLSLRRRGVIDVPRETSRS